MPRSIEEVFPPDKYEYIPRVAVFKTHTRLKNGKLVKVTKKELDATAQVHNHLFDVYGRFSPFSKGHTLDKGPGGAEVSEEDQPDTCGGGVNLYVEKSPDPTEEDDYILYCTWAVPKDEKEEVLKNYVSISPEFYPSKNWIFPFSLLKSSAPEIPDMPIIPLRYSVELKPGEEQPYSLVIDNPFRYSSETDSMPFEKDDEKMKDEAPKKEAKEDKPKNDKPEDKAMDAASKANEKGSVESASAGEQALQMLQQFLPLLQWLQELKDQEDAGEDLMEPADKSKGMDEPAKKDAPVPEKDKSFDNPVKFDASMPSATNTSIPSFDKKDKETYTVSKNDEVAKYKAELDAAKAESAAAMKIAKDLHEKNRKSEAKELVAEIESVCKYRSEKARQEDLDMLAKLDEKVAKQYVAMAKERYERKLPDSKSVEEVAKYAVEKEPDLTAKTPEEAHERAMAIIKSGLSREEYYKQMAQGKKN